VLTRAQYFIIFWVRDTIHALTLYFLNRHFIITQLSITMFQVVSFRLGFSTKHCVPLFQNEHQQDDTYGLSFISRLVVLYATCFELQGAHHQEFTFSTLYRQSLAYCIIGNRTRRRTGGIQQKIIQYARDCLYSVEKVNSWWWAPWSSKHVE